MISDHQYILELGSIEYQNHLYISANNFIMYIVILKKINTFASLKLETD